MSVYTMFVAKGACRIPSCTLEVHINQTIKFSTLFLENSHGLLSTGDLQRLAQRISADPPSDHKADLNVIDWVYLTGEEEIPCKVWYVQGKGVSHIDVVALTTASDDANEASPSDLDDATRDTSKLMKLMQLFRRVLSSTYDNNDPPADEVF